MKINVQKTAILSACAVIVVLVGMYIYQLSTRNAVENLAANHKIIHVLVAGTNQYHRNRHSFYAIFSINPENNRAGITFLPPTLELDIDGELMKLADVDMSDFDHLKDALYTTLKLHVPFYVILYPPDVQRAVDITNGMQVFMLQKNDSIHNSGFGVQYLDGQKVMQYVNSVDAGSIYRKYDRIMDLLFTVYSHRADYEKYAEEDSLLEIMHDVKTNLLDNEIVSLAALAVKAGDLTFITLPGHFSTAGQYYVDEVALRNFDERFLRRLMGEDPDGESLAVKILNGTDVPGLARKLRVILVNEGINVLEFGTFSYGETDSTLIINRRGNLAAVEKIAKLVGAGRIEHSIDSTQLQDVLIITGRDMADGNTQENAH